MVSQVVHCTNPGSSTNNSNWSPCKGTVMSVLAFNSTDSETVFVSSHKRRILGWEFDRLARFDHLMEEALLEPGHWLVRCVLNEGNFSPLKGLRLCSYLAF